MSEIDCQCARCGSSCGWQDCESCVDGYSSHNCGEDCCFCDDPDEYNVPCDFCRTKGGWWVCLSDAEWCEANPLPGREATPRGEIEWFDVVGGSSEERDKT